MTAPSSAPVGNPTITSDQADYAPGSLVTLTGTGWQPGESVHIYVNDDWGSSWSRNVDVVADSSGAIVDQFNLPNWFAAFYRVVATGSLSGIAAAEFTDAAVNVRIDGTSGTSGTITWARFNNTSCTGTSAASGSFIAGTIGNGTAVPSGADASQSLRLNADSISGFEFVNWTRSSGAVLSAPNPFCLQGDGNTQNIRANYGSNSAPVAVNDSYATDEDSTLTVVAPGVLANDTDSDGNPLTVGVPRPASGPSNGSLTLNANGSFGYTPNSNFNGSDSFTYYANDGTTNSTSAATVTIGVDAVDDAPVAVDDTKTVLEDAAATAIDVLANDTDIDGGAKSVASVTQPTNGAVVITDGGTGLTYQPNTNYCNGGSPTDNFTYTLNGGSTATLRVTVTCVNDAPVVVVAGDFSAADEGEIRNYAYTITDVDSSSHAVTETCGTNATYLSDGLADSFDCMFREGPGDTTVNVTANDLSATNNIGDDPHKVDVDNVAPTVTLSGPAAANEGDTKSYSHSWTDPGTDDTFPALGNSINCGVHGTASDVVFTPLFKTGTFNCTWSDDSGSGTADVSATVTDDDGGADTDKIHVDVDNVAPTVTNLTANPSAAIVGQTIVVTGTASDPSSADTTAGFEWRFDTGSGYGTFGSSNTVSTLVTTCGPITIKAQARDKDAGISAEATVVVQTFNGAFLSPLKEGVSNLVQKGRVVPVQISFGCGGAITGLHPEIQLLKGDFVANAGTEGSGDNLITESVSNADTGNVMRELSGKYMYNLAIPSSGMTAGQALTVRVRPFGPNTQPTMYVLLEIRK